MEKLAPTGSASYASGFIAIALPLCLLCLYSDILFPYVTSKVWMLRTFTLVGLAVAVFSNEFTNRFQSLLKQPLFWALLAYCSWGLASNQFSEEPSRAFWSTYERLEGGMGLIHLVLLTLFLYCALGTDSRQRNYLIVLILTAIILVVSALETEDRRIFGLLGNPIYLGTAAGLSIFILGFLYARYWLPVQSALGKRGGQLCVLLIAMLFLMALYRSGSRGPAVGFIGGVLVAILWGWKLKTQANFKKWVVVVVGWLLTLMVAIWLAGMTLQSSELEKGSLWYRFLQIPAGNQTTLDRLANWSIAVDVIKERPIIGHGSEAYVREFSQHYQAGVLDNADLWFDRAHNAYLDILVAHGIVGFFLFWIVVGVSLYCLFYRSSYTWQQQTLLLGLISCYAIKNIVGFDSAFDNVVWVTFLVFVMLADNSNKGGKLRADKDKIGVRLGKLVFSTMMLIAIYFTVLLPFRANYTVLSASLYTRATRDFNDPVGKARLGELRAMLTHADKQFPPSKAEHLQAFYVALSEKESFSNELLDDFYQRSRAIVLAQPDNHRIQFNAALLLAKSGEFKIAIRLFEQLVKQTPNRTLFWLMLARLYQINKEPSKAELAREQIKKLNLGYFNKHFS